MSGVATEETRAVMFAVRHSTRVEILRQLEGADPPKPVSPIELSRQLRRPLSHVGYHVRVLAECELIRLTRTKRVRNSIQHFYATTDRVKHPVAQARLAGAER